MEEPDLGKQCIQCIQCTQCTWRAEIVRKQAIGVIEETKALLPQIL